MGFLPARLPSSTGARPDTSERLALRVGSLFGIAATPGPAGHVWVAQYDALTLGEIARGGPLPSREWHKEQSRSRGKAAVGDSLALPNGTWWVVDRALVRGTGPQDATIPGAIRVDDVHEIAASTLNRMLPDRKAAAVLQGANVLLGEAEETVRLVLATLSTGLAPRAVLALWAILTQEVYRSQPALFAAAVQARAIQRALTVPWSPRARPSEPAARSEFGSADVTVVDGGTIDRRLRALQVLDDTVPEDLRLFGPGGVDEQRNTAFLRDDLIARWTRHLLNWDDRGFVWIEETVPGVRTVEVLLSTVDPVVAFVAEQHGPLPAGFFGGSAAAERMCPEPPDRSVLQAMDDTQRTALVWTLVQMYRVLRQEAVREPDFRRDVTSRLAEVAALAEDVLGPVHVMTLWARNRYAEARYTDSTEAQDAAGMREAGLDTLTTVAAIGDVRRTGRVPTSFFAESLLSSAVPLRMEAAELEAIGERDRARGFREETDAVWRSFFSTIGVSVDDVIERADDPTGFGNVALDAFLHNYAAYLIDSSDPADHRTAARLMVDVVLPSRRRLSEMNALERPRRLSMQVAIRAIERLLLDDLAVLDDEERLEWSALAASLTRELRTSALLTETLSSRGDLTETDRNALERLLSGAILSYEWGHEIDGLTLDEVVLHLDRLIAQRATAGSGVAVARDRLSRLLERAKRLAPTGRVVTSRAIPLDAAMAGAAAVRGDASETTGTGGRGGAGPAEAAEHRDVTIEDDQLFETLRGAPRKFFESSLSLGLDRTSDGRLSVEMVLSVLDPAVGAVHVVVSSDTGSVEIPLSWERRAGAIVRLTGSADAADIELPEARIEVKVRVDE